MDIAPGTEVEVLYRNSMYDRRHLYASHMHIPEFYTYRGAVYPRQKWQGPQTLNLTTGDANWPWRELQDAQIITVRAGEQTLEPLRKEVSKDRVWEVSGSKGNTYTVTEVAGKRTCTCPGFQFRHSCKHTLEAR